MQIKNIKGDGLIKRLFYRVWHSATMMTWGSLLSKSLTFFLVLPLILTRFPEEDIALWYLFVIIIKLQLLADLGFSPTFTRVIAFATAGAKRDQIHSFEKKDEISASKDANWDTIEAICSTMKVVYNRLTVAAVFLLMTAGTYMLYEPIQNSSDPFQSYISWGVILVNSFFILRGNQYSAYLQGLNKIALVRRWEAITNVGAILTSFIVLLTVPDILWLVVANQAWLLINVIRNYVLCRIVEEGRFKYFERDNIDSTVMEAVWPSAWRSGVGLLMGKAPIQFSGLLYAQIGNTSMVASYLLGLDLITSLRSFSIAPFYSKIPLLNKFRASGEIKRQLKMAQRGMAFSYWVYLFGFIAIGILGDPLTEFIGSNADFPSLLLWNLLGIGMFIERFGAMHLHLYTTTNIVIWHTANGITGAIFIATAWALLSTLDVYAFPVAYIISYLLFYAPFTANKSYKLFSENFFSFEKRIFIPPLSVILIYFIILLII